LTLWCPTLGCGALLDVPPMVATTEGCCFMGAAVVCPRCAGRHVLTLGLVPDADDDLVASLTRC
jgi:hypothetical protein